MVEMVRGSKVADVESVYQGEIYFGVFHIQMALEVAGVVHSQDHIVVGQIVLAEDVQTILCKVAVEA